MGASVTMQTSARGLCFWYEAVHVSKALASRRYRIGNLVELVRGGSAVIGRRFPTHLFDSTRAVCCVRPLHSRAFAKTLRAMRQAGIRVVADYDDLLFAGAVSGLPPSVGSSRPKSYAAALDSFDAFSVSTRPLAWRLTQIVPNKPVAVIPNALSDSWVRQGKVLYKPFLSGDPLVIRYLCGSPSHDADFACIRQPLAQFLRDQPTVRLEVIGPVNFDSSGFPPLRVQHLPAVPYDELPRLLASSWVTLAPLVSTAFNECKSAIKFLESAAFACPSLVSPNDDLERHQERGAPILSCRSEQDWYERLTSLLQVERRLRDGAAAADYVTAHAMASSNVDPWLRFLAAPKQG